MSPWRESQVTQHPPLWSSSPPAEVWLLGAREQGALCHSLLGTWGLERLVLLPLSSLSSQDMMPPLPTVPTTRKMLRKLPARV